MSTTDLTYVPPVYLSCTDTAKLVRQALKAAFPGVKFSVRSSSYSGGASIHVDWTDGPTGTAVDAVAGRFSGASFDGMVDLKTSNRHWLLPDGTVALAHAGGQGSTNPEVFGDAPAPNARLVRFGADYILSQRKVSDGWRAEIAAEIAAYTGEPFAPNSGYPVSTWADRDSEQGGAGLAINSHRDGWGSDLVWQIAAQRTRGVDCEHGRHGHYGAGAGVFRCTGCGAIVLHPVQA